MQRKVGLIGRRGDPQLERLRAALLERGGEAIPFDLADVPSHVNFHWEGEELRLGELVLGTFDAFYAREAHFPMPVFIPGQSREGADAATFPVRETGSLLNAVVYELAQRAPMINPPRSHRFHRMKPLMYRVLQQAGVPVPEFAVGCDLAAAAHFVERHGERVVIKPLMGGEVHVADFNYLRDHHEEVDKRPLLLQRRICGRSLRAYVVGDQVVAAAEVVHGDVVDWRTDVRDLVPVDLDSAAARAVRRAVRVLGLLFAAVDVEEDKESESPWVIDVNPAPMFAAFEGRTGVDVAGQLAKILMEAADGGRLPEFREE